MVGETEQPVQQQAPPTHTHAVSHDDPNTVSSSSFFPPPKIQPGSLFTLRIFQTIFVISPQPKFGGLSWQPRAPTSDTSGSSRSGDHLFAAGRASELWLRASQRRLPRISQKKHHRELQVLTLVCFFKFPYYCVINPFQYFDWYILKCCSCL